MKQFVKVPAGLFQAVVNFISQQPINQLGDIHTALMKCPVIEEPDDDPKSSEKDGKKEGPPPPPTEKEKTVEEVMKGK